ncbi:MAG: U32 family peptidase [Pseudomonadota bacterium]
MTSSIQPTTTRTAPKLTLGPLPYYWPREQTLAFYREVADWPVEVVYLGETVCSKRHELRLADWIEIGAQLAAAGKEVVLSTLGLIEAEADLRAVRGVVEQSRFRVEANDMNAVNLLAGRARFVAGPFLNVYNADTLKLLQDAGAVRWVAPIELPAAGIATLLRELATPIEVEAIAHARLPLAMSARCFTARYHNLSKDHCEYRCIRHPDGIALATQEGEPLFTMNGIQTQSAQPMTLLDELPRFADLGIGLARIGPQSSGTARVVALFDAVRRGAMAASEALAQARANEPIAANGYWHGQPGRAAAAVMH